MSYALEHSAELNSLEKVNLEDLLITNFPDKETFFKRFVALAQDKRRTSVSLTYNVHSANLAYQTRQYKSILQQADILRCDGVGALLASRMVGSPIQARLTNADYFPEMLEYLADQGLTVFLLGGKPGVVEKALAKLEIIVCKHSVVGVHHGYIANNPALNQSVVDQINALKPDVVVVGLGMPLQEYWIAEHRDQLDVGILFAVGALIDYFGGAQYRCPAIFRKLGLEWLTRLVRYPKRMFTRYVIGNPFFLGRIMIQALLKKRTNPRLLKEHYSGSV